MTVARSHRRRFAPLPPALISLMLAVGPALAQTAAPASSAPLSTAPAIRAPDPAPDPAPSQPTASPPTEPAKSDPAPAVEAAPLQSLDLFSAAGRSTGLAPSLWRGASAELAARVFAGLGQTPLEPGLGALARRVLATGANAPDGAGADADLAGARAQALLALGDLDGARTLLSRTPGVSAHAGLSRVAAESALWGGDLDRACAIGDALAEGKDQVFWLRLRGVCLVRAGKTQEAQLALDLAAQSASRSPDLERKLSVLLASGGDPGPASAQSALALALSRLLKLDLTPAVDGAPLPGLFAIAADETASATARRLAALRLIHLGADATETVRAAWLLPVPDAPPPPVAPPLRRGKGRTRAAPAAPAQPDVGQVADQTARLYAQARTGTDGAVRTPALLALLSGAHGAAFRAVANVAAPEIATVAAEGLSAPDRLLLAQAAAAVEAPNSQALRDSLKLDEPNAVSALDLALLDGLRALSDPDKALPEALDRLTDRGAQGDPAGRPKAQAAAGLLLGLLAPQQRRPSAAQRAQLAQFRLSGSERGLGLILAEDAAERHAQGDAALLALDIGRSGLTPGDRAALVRVLSRVALTAEARAIAADGLISLMGR